MKRRVQKLVNSKSFATVVSLLILLCSISLGWETFYQYDSFAEELFYFKLLDIFFTLSFTVEIILRMIAEPRFGDFFKVFRISRSPKLQLHFSEHGFWNTFDTLIVVISLYALLTQSLFVHPDLPIIARDLRVLKVFRLLDINDRIKYVERKIVRIVPMVFAFLALLLILIYVYSIMGIYLFNYTDFSKFGCGHANFSNVFDACLTLFRVITLDSWWSDISTGISECKQFTFLRSSLVELYFVSFIILTVIISFNVFIAVLTNEVHTGVLEEERLTNPDLEQKVDQLYTELQEIKALLKKNVSDT